MTSTRTFRLPDVGEGLTEAEVVRWLVAEGDELAVNAPVVEVETAKSIVELPSPWAGRVEKLLVPEGLTVDVGTELIAVGVEDPGEPAGDSAGDAGAADAGVTGSGAGSDEGAPDAGAPGDEPSVVDLDAVPAGQGAGLSEASEEGGSLEEEPDPGATSVLVGYGVREGSAPGRRRRRRTGRASAAVPAAPPAPAPARAQPTSPNQPTAVPGGHDDAGPAAPKPLATPPVRLLARLRGIDLASLTGSGAGGVITREDVLEEPADPGAGGATTGRGARPGGSAPDLPGEYDARARERRVPVRGVRKATAQAMVASAFTAPHTSARITVDATRTVKLLDRLRADRSFEGVHVSPLLVLARAMCLAVARHPEINSWWDEEAQEIVVKDYVNLGVAVASGRGLLVPNVKDAQALDLRALAGALTDLVKTARAGRTSPSDMARGTISITNIGVFGVDGGTPILNPGEAAILCMGAMTQRPWVHKGRIRPRWVVELSLSFDHRVVDGDLGSRFLADVGALLERPDRALLWA